MAGMMRHTNYKEVLIVKRSKNFKALARALGVVSAVVVVVSVQTASMVPAFRPGDALVVAPVLPRDLRLGEIVSYRNPRNPNVTITHRLVAINKRTGWLTTAGDAYRSPDPSFPPGLLAGRATAIAPGLGVVLNTLRRPIGLALVIYSPAAFIVAVEVRRLSSAYARPFYSARL